jgi:hypothetical protein
MASLRLAGVEMWRRLFLLTCIVIGTSPAATADQAQPSRQFCGALIHHWNLCSLEAQLVAEGGKANPDDCQARFPKDTRPYYDKALKSSPNDKAKSMVKDIYAYSLSSVSGLTPTDGELKIAYENRIDTPKRKIDEMCDRLLLEIE